MAAERAKYPVKMMAELLEVSRQGFYQWVSRVPDPDPWSRLRDAILAVWETSMRIFGARQILHGLPEEFDGTTLYRVRKLMRELGICGVVPHKKKRTTIPDEDAPTRPDLLKRDFTSPVPTYKLVGDITYLRTGEGWLYLATVIDLATRMVVGWAIAPRMTADIVVSALEMAHGRGYVADGSIFHSDRGSQYTSSILARWARAHNVRLSVGRTGSCHDNAVAESFFGSLKNEWYHRFTFETRAKARTAVIWYIESFYNRMRPHSSVGWRRPAELMGEFFVRFDSGLEEVRMAA